MGRNAIALSDRLKAENDLLRRMSEGYYQHNLRLAEALAALSVGVMEVQRAYQDGESAMVLTLSADLRNRLDVLGKIMDAYVPVSLKEQMLGKMEGKPDEQANESEGSTEVPGPSGGSGELSDRPTGE